MLVEWGYRHPCLPQHMLTAFPPLNVIRKRRDGSNQSNAHLEGARIWRKDIDIDFMVTHSALKSRRDKS